MLTVGTILTALFLCVHVGVVNGARRIHHTRGRNRTHRAGAGALVQHHRPLASSPRSGDAVHDASVAGNTSSAGEGPEEAPEALHHHGASTRAASPTLHMKAFPVVEAGGNAVKLQGTGSAASPHSPPVVTQVMESIPGSRQLEGSQCFQLGSEEEYLGCRQGCQCKWFERCYPRHVLWRRDSAAVAHMRDHGSLNSTITSLFEDGELTSIDVGACAWSMNVMIMLSFGAFLTSTITVVILRMCLLLINDLREHMSGGQNTGSPAPLVAQVDTRKGGGGGTNKKIISTFRLP